MKLGEGISTLGGNNLGATTKRKYEVLWSTVKIRVSLCQQDLLSRLFYFIKMLYLAYKF